MTFEICNKHGDGEIVFDSGLNCPACEDVKGYQERIEELEWEKVDLIGKVARWKENSEDLVKGLKADDKKEK